MKQLIITLFIAVAALTVQAQTIKQDSNKVDTILIRSIDLNKIQYILNYSFNWIPRSEAPANEVRTLIPLIKTVYPLLIPYIKPKAAGKPKQ